MHTTWIPFHFFLCTRYANFALHFSNLDRAKCAVISPTVVDVAMACTEVGNF